MYANCDYCGDESDDLGVYPEGEFCDYFCYENYLNLQRTNNTSSNYSNSSPASSYSSTINLPSMRSIKKSVLERTEKHDIYKARTKYYVYTAIALTILYIPFIQFFNTSALVPEDPSPGHISYVAAIIMIFSQLLWQWIFLIRIAWGIITGIVQNFPSYFLLLAVVGVSAGIENLLFDFSVFHYFNLFLKAIYQIIFP